MAAKNENKNEIFIKKGQVRKKKTILATSKTKASNKNKDTYEKILLGMVRSYGVTFKGNSHEIIYLLEGLKSVLFVCALTVSRIKEKLFVINVRYKLFWLASIN